ncbi:hypothetical protein GCM10027271_58880 [Saccharopolyspora gloriosae]
MEQRAAGTASEPVRGRIGHPDEAPARSGPPRSAADPDDHSATALVADGKLRLSAGRSFDREIWSASAANREGGLGRHAEM